MKLVESSDGLTQVTLEVWDTTGFSEQHLAAKALGAYAKKQKDRKAAYRLAKLSQKIFTLPSPEHTNGKGEDNSEWRLSAVSVNMNSQEALLLYEALEHFETLTEIEVGFTGADHRNAAVRLLEAEMAEDMREQLLSQFEEITIEPPSTGINFGFSRVLNLPEPN